MKETRERQELGASPAEMILPVNVWQMLHTAHLHKHSIPTVKHSAGSILLGMLLGRKPRFVWVEGKGNAAIGIGIKEGKNYSLGEDFLIRQSPECVAGLVKGYSRERSSKRCLIITISTL